MPFYFAIAAVTDALMLLLRLMMPLRFSPHAVAMR